MLVSGWNTHFCQTLTSVQSTLHSSQKSFLCCWFFHLIPFFTTSLIAFNNFLLRHKSPFPAKMKLLHWSNIMFKELKRCTLHFVFRVQFLTSSPFLPRFWWCRTPLLYPGSSELSSRRHLACPLLPLQGRKESPELHSLWVSQPDSSLPGSCSELWPLHDDVGQIFHSATKPAQFLASGLSEKITEVM